MNTATSYLVASLLVAIFLTGIGAYAMGDKSLTEARGSYPGRRERRRAHGWFAIAWACWAVDCVLLLALR